MKTRTLPIFAAVFALAVTRGVFAETAPCAVPGDHSTIQAALDDAHCDRVNVAAGTYPGNFTVSHSMTIVGASVALLYAPQSGKDTRRLIAKKTEEGRDILADSGKEVLDRGKELFDRGRELADEAADIFERGRKLVRG